MEYRAHVRLDFGEKDNNEYQKLITAFIQLGWRYIETSAVMVETGDLGTVLKGLDLLARQIPFAGTPTGILVDVQGSENFNGKSYAAAANHKNALADITAKRPPLI